MKKSYKTFLLAAMLLMSVGASAKHVSPTEARKVAETFLKGVGCKQYNQLVDRTAEMEFHQMYLFTAEEGGFVLVSADDCAMPILGYSATGHFATKGMPVHVAGWLAGYEEEIAHLSQCVNEPVALWRELLKGTMPKATLDTAVAPLMTTQWDQSPFYNALCPADEANSSGHAYAGCTAVATAQVMKYWNFPEKGYGSHSYEHSTYGTLSADFGSTTYQWSKMPNSLTAGSSLSFQINAVATLIYHVGVAVEMKYGPNGSRAPLDNKGNFTTASAENALREFFKYKSNLNSIFQSDCNPNEYLQILYNELNNSRPILYAGDDESDGGHAFVLDGYDSTGAFHINWGWGGFEDGFYAIGALNPYTYTFNTRGRAVIGIEPSYDFDTASTTVVTAVSFDTNYGSITGAGTYNFGDTVNLKAIANEGCHFAKWSDGNRCNPRTFIATGGSYDFYAIIEPLRGDTLSYCATNRKLSTLGYSTPRDIYWGIRLPASTLTAGHHLRKVQLYINSVGNYSTLIYVGNTSNAVHTQDFVATDDDKNTWKTIELDAPVPIDGTHDLWIYFHTTDLKYPATYTFYSGNPDGKLWGTSFAPLSNRDRSFMIRGIFSAEPITITATPNDTVMGTVTGSGIYTWGDTATLTATPNSGYLFSRWSDGVADNPRTLIATEDVTLEAIFVHDSIGIGEVADLDLKLYPNPTNGKVHVEGAVVERMRVYDPMGREVASFEGSNDVDLGTLGTGIYTLHIVTPRGIAVKKVVKSDF